MIKVKSKSLLLVSSMLLSSFIFSCSSGIPITPYPDSAQASSSYPYPRPTPSYNPEGLSVPYNSVDLSSLRAGILPDPSLNESEKKLAGVLVRQTIPVFPMKIGILLYKDTANIPENDRRVNFDSFIKKLKSNPNVGQVIEVSSNLISRNPDIEAIRQLAARFQVSSIVVLSETYQTPSENKEGLITPIDMVTGTRTWESFAKIEAYGLDILNGVFIFSTASGARELDKYKKSTE